jgi:hypothetical protein
MLKKALAVMTAAISMEASAQGTIVIAHGGDSLWNSHVLEAARAARTGGPVEVSFLMGPAAKSTRFQDVIARLEAGGAREITVVPLLVSSHSGHFEQSRYLTGDTVRLDEAMQHHLHMAGIERPSTSVKLLLTRAMDDAAQVAEVLTSRALSLARNARERAVMIVGHGPNSADDYASWMRADRAAAPAHGTGGARGPGAGLEGVDQPQQAADRPLRAADRVHRRAAASPPGHGALDRGALARRLGQRGRRRAVTRLTPRKGVPRFRAPMTNRTRAQHHLHHHGHTGPGEALLRA